MRILMLMAILPLLTPVCAHAQAVPPQQADGRGPGTGKPANLCQELVAFARRPETVTKAAETPPQLATAVTARRSDDVSAKPVADNTPQSSSGQSGQITASGPGAAGPQGTSQNMAAPAGSTATASGPERNSLAADSEAPKSSAENVTQIESAAQANDLQACRALAQNMRRAGVVMPAPLLALAAMSPKLLEAAPPP